MNKKELKAVIEKYKSGQATDEEKAIFESWYLEHHKGEIANYSAEELLEDLHLIWMRLEQEYVAPAKTVRLWPKIAVAAAIVAVILFGVWFFSPPAVILNLFQDPNVIAMKNDIAPGSNRATLTLANGKVIVLSNAKTGVAIGEELRYNDGSTVANLSPSGREARGREGSNSGNSLSPKGGSLPEGERSRMQNLTASTPRGGTYQVTLPDGTHVWLNAESKISFPSQFSGKERKILLSGEAYFEVAKLIHLSPSGKDGRRPERVPFIVESKGQQVEVLGTHFNVNAYNDEASVKTTLLEGSVNVNGVILKPNQQAIVKGGALNVTEINADDVIAWKRGEFAFKGEDIRSIMNRVAKWYDIEVIYNGTIPSEGFNGIVSRSKNISQVLKMLEETNAVHFKVEGKRVYVSK